ncbi:hypothetical protein bcgnr5410_56550 [Bacillus cereus]
MLIFKECNLYILTMVNIFTRKFINFYVNNEYVKTSNKRKLNFLSCRGDSSI